MAVIKVVTYAKSFAADVADVIHKIICADVREGCAAFVTELIIVKIDAFAMCVLTVEERTRSNKNG